jgi:hypothetical protein
MAEAGLVVAADVGQEFSQEKGQQASQSGASTKVKKVSSVFGREKLRGRLLPSQRPLSGWGLELASELLGDPQERLK